MDTPLAAGERPDRARTALRGATLLTGCYLVVSLLAIVVIVLFRGDASVVDDAVWTRGTIVLASAALTFAFAVQAARGSRRAYLRLRLVSAVMVVAIIVIIALPGVFPLWMKLEQGGCGALLLGVVVIVNGRRVRSSFGAR